jgi:SAM-dependent methyltransferase
MQALFIGSMVISNKQATSGAWPEVSVVDWEQVAVTTRWGSHVASVESRLIRSGEYLARPASEALEIGCDKGRWSKMLADLGWQMTCIDVNEEALVACKHRIPSARCILADPRDHTLPLNSGSLSLILCIEVAPVIESDWFISEASRVLKTEGILVGVAWNRTSWRGLYAWLEGLQGKTAKAGYYTRSYGAFRRELLDNGFLPVEEEGYCWEPFPRTSDSRLIPWFTGLGPLLGLNRVVGLSPWVGFVARKAGG